MLYEKLWLKSSDIDTDVSPVETFEILKPTTGRGVPVSIVHVNDLFFLNQQHTPKKNSTDVILLSALDQRNKNFEVDISPDTKTLKREINLQVFKKSGWVQTSFNECIYDFLRLKEKPYVYPAYEWSQYTGEIIKNIDDLGKITYDPDETDSIKPSKRVIFRAKIIMQELFMSIQANNYSWRNPFFSADHLGVIGAQWRYGDRSLYIDIEENELWYTKIWETDNATETQFGILNCTDFLKFWKWLING